MLRRQLPSRPGPHPGRTIIVLRCAASGCAHAFGREVVISFPSEPRVHAPDSRSGLTHRARCAGAGAFRTLPASGSWANDYQSQRDPALNFIAFRLTIRLYWA